MTRAAYFTETDELTILRGLVSLPATSFRSIEVDELIELLKSLRVQRVAGEFPVRVAQTDVTSVDWLLEEMRRAIAGRPALLVTGGLGISVALSSLRIRLRDRLIEQQRVAVVV